MATTSANALTVTQAPRQQPLIDAARWSAVIARDRTADGTFFYSVLTTGVYCRPSCPSRRPLRENVSFHASVADAESAGFRPCKRCRPNEASQIEQHAAMVAAACRSIESATEIPSLDALASGVGMSPYHFHRIFKQVTGVTPRAYAVAHRSQRVRTQLRQQSSVTDAIYTAGFNSNAPFYSTASQTLGMTPTEFRTGAMDIEIRFACGECSLGSILVAATNKGVCAILMGDDPEVLVRDLQDRFARARLIGGDAEFEQLVAKVVGLVEAPGIGVELQLDIRGTAFQQRVWQALREIPSGKTESYRDIAAKLGSPRAVRAVAQACAANPIAIAIPCHRVVRTDGALSGYRWGVERKRTLLDREKNK